VGSFSKGKQPKPKDDHPKDFSSAAGVAGYKHRVQVFASRQIYDVDSNDEMIID